MVGNAGSNLTYDNYYNRRIAEIVANYEKVDDFNKPQDFMKHLIGAGRPKPFIQSGDTPYDNEAVFDSVGLTAGRAFKQKKKGVAKLLRTVGLAVKPLGKTVKPLKDALVARAVSEIGGAKKSSPWIVHVKQYCAKHGCSYKEGLKLASPSYKK